MSTTSRKVEELMGLPVFSVHEGERLGNVSGVLVRREERVVEAIGVGGGPFRQPRYVRLTQLSTIGTDAVMAPSAAIMKEALSAQHVRAMESHLAGRPVMSASGQRLGEVVSFTLQIATGRIESYRVRPDAANKSWLASLIKSETIELSDSLVVSLGANALIVRDEAISLVRPETAAEPTPAVEPAPAAGSPSEAEPIGRPPGPLPAAPPPTAASDETPV